ncbi:MAG: hypothetical protein AVDCRST_MAG20-2974, partial [uncultured Acidimicrobiales bacterium]
GRSGCALGQRDLGGRLMGFGRLGGGSAGPNRVGRAEGRL